MFDLFSCTDFIIRFKPPLVTFFQTPAIKSTEGNFYIKILGQNFGTETANVVVYIEHNRLINSESVTHVEECPIRNHTHFEIFCISRKLDIFRFSFFPK